MFEELLERIPDIELAGEPSTACAPTSSTASSTCPSRSSSPERGPDDRPAAAHATHGLGRRGPAGGLRRSGDVRVHGRLGADARPDLRTGSAARPADAEGTDWLNWVVRHDGVTSVCPGHVKGRGHGRGGVGDRRALAGRTATPLRPRGRGRSADRRGCARTSGRTSTPPTPPPLESRARRRARTDRRVDRRRGHVGAAGLVVRREATTRGRRRRRCGGQGPEGRGSEACARLAHRRSRAARRTRTAMTRAPMKAAMAACRRSDRWSTRRTCSAGRPGASRPGRCCPAVR